MYYVQYVIYSLLPTKFKHFQLPYLHNYFKMLLVKMLADGKLPSFYTTTSEQ